MKYPIPEKPSIKNTISTANLGQDVDVYSFNKYPWGRFDMVNNYNGRVGYIKNNLMEGRVSVFSSGKMISTGARSVLSSIRQLNEAVNQLVKNAFIKRVKLIPKVQNIVATVNVGCRIDLNEIACLVPKVTFEPDQFPGAILRMSEGPVCLLFASGKIVVTGSKSEAILTNTVSALMDILKPFHIMK